MSPGIIYGLVVFLAYSVADSIIKGLGNDLSIWQIGFFISIFGLVPTALTKPRTERWADVFTPRLPLLLHVRCLLGYLATISITYSFVTIPMAEVYSLVFLTPVFVMLISVPVFGERIRPLRWVILMFSLIGTLLVIQPGFGVLVPGHLSAVAHAGCAAATSLLIKRLSTVERQISMMTLPVVYSVAFNGIMMQADFLWPTPRQWLLLLTIGCISSLANLLFIIASRTTPIGRLQLTHYSQIVWGALLGLLVYSEVPNTVAVLGIALVIMAGLANAAATDV